MTFNVKFFNRTMAHELGHGAFAWQHPFDEPFKNEQGVTRNLMDYVNDDDLAYFQWQSTLGLNLTWGFLEEDEDGMMIDYHYCKMDSALFRNIFIPTISSIFSGYQELIDYFTRTYIPMNNDKIVWVPADGKKSFAHVIRDIQPITKDSEEVFSVALIASVIYSSMTKDMDVRITNNTNEGNMTTDRGMRINLGNPQDVIRLVRVQDVIDNSSVDSFLTTTIGIDDYTYLLFHELIHKLNWVNDDEPNYSLEERLR